MLHIPSLALGLYKRKAFGFGFFTSPLSSTFLDLYYYFTFKYVLLALRNVSGRGSASQMGIGEHVKLPCWSFLYVVCS
jgi:hypothetical protein